MKENMFHPCNIESREEKINLIRGSLHKISKSVVVIK